MPQAEAVISGTVANGATTIIWFNNRNDQQNYPGLLAIEGRMPVDFVHLIGDGALELRLNDNIQRRFYLPAAGAIEIGDAKAHGVAIANASGAERTFTLRLVSR